MNCFSNTSEAVEAIPRETHLKWDELRLLEVQKLYPQAEAEFNLAWEALKNYDSGRQQVEAVLTRATKVRNALLTERADLRLKLGLRK